MQCFSEAEMLRLAGSAMHKMDTRGRRGTEAVTYEEIEAMGVLIDCCGAGKLCQQAFLQKLGAKAIEDAEILDD